MAQVDEVRYGMAGAHAPWKVQNAIWLTGGQEVGRGGLWGMMGSREGVGGGEGGNSGAPVSGQPVRCREWNSIVHWSPCSLLYRVDAQSPPTPTSLPPAHLHQGSASEETHSHPNDQLSLMLSHVAGVGRLQTAAGFGLLGTSARLQKAWLLQGIPPPHQPPATPP